VARYTDSACRICRREGDKLYLKGTRCNTEKCAFSRRGYAPGQHGQARRKPTPYCQQLREKQKIRRMYGMLESQFHLFFERAAAKKGVTGENLLRMLECRLDNVAFRAGFAVSRTDARQLVRHGHVNVNGRRVDIPSFVVKVGDIVEIPPKSAARKRVQEAIASASARPPLQWLQCDHQTMKASVVSLPGRADIDQNINESAVVELYSK